MKARGCMLVLVVLVALAVCCLLTECGRKWSEWRKESAIADHALQESAAAQKASEAARQQFIARLNRGDAFFARRLWGQAADEYQLAWDNGVPFSYLQANRYLAASVATGRYANAQRTGERILQKVNHNDENAQWTPIYTSLAILAQGRRVEAQSFARHASLEFPVTQWPYPLLLFLGGELSADRLVTEVGDVRGRKTEALTLVGCVAFYNGDTARAAEALRWVIEKGDKDYLETAIAEDVYERLGARRLPATGGEERAVRVAEPAAAPGAKSGAAPNAVPQDQMKAKPLAKDGNEAIGALWLKNASNQAFPFQMLGPEGWATKTLGPRTNLFLTSQYEIAIRWKQGGQYVKPTLTYYVQPYFRFNGYNLTALKQIAPTQVISLNSDGTFQVNAAN